MAPSRAMSLRRITQAIAQPLAHPASSRLSYPRVNNFCTSVSRFPRAQFQRCTVPVPYTRAYSQPADATLQPPDYLNEAELHIFNKIKAELEPVKLEVQDVSGGCGSMYAIEIESPKFKGLTPIKQHKLVNAVLKEEIAKWHGVQLRTKAA